MTCLEYIKSDLYRYHGDTKFLHFLKSFFFQKGFNYMVYHRLCNYGGKIGKIFLPILKLKSHRGITIPSSVEIGYGLYIGHGGPIIINPTAIIGNNCNLSQFTTIGSNEGKAAIIGDNTYIGPNVCIVEHIKVGNNCTIGAGSVVTKDIPENATAAGNYAKVLNFRNPGKYIRNKWKY